MEQLKTIRRKISVEKEHTSYDLNPSEPLFTARYLGKEVVTESFSPSTGYALCVSYTELLLRSKKTGRSPRKVELLISRNITRGLSLLDPSGKVPEETFQLQNIAFCTTIKLHSKIFTFIAEQEGKLYCHAFLCSKKAKAQAICLAVTRAFTMAYDDWSRKKSRSLTKKERKAKETAIHDVISADEIPNNGQDSGKNDDGSVVNVVGDQEEEEEDGSGNGGGRSGALEHSVHDMVVITMTLFDEEDDDDDFREFVENRLHTQEDLEELENSPDVMELVRGDRSGSEGTEYSANDENDNYKD